MEARLRLDGVLGPGDGPILLGPTRALLDALAQEGSLQGAARRLGLSYRSAWGRLAALERALGRAVVVKTKGHGSTLTPFGAALRNLISAAFGRIEPAIAAEEASLREGLRALLAPQPEPLRLAASHDPLLAGLIEAMPEIELTVAGSVEALSRLAAGTADAAAFHYGAEGAAPPPFDAVFRDADLGVHPLFRREQGLMVAPGNPLGIACVADIVEKRARFVNRQRGAGTRIWFERLCAEAGIATEGIAGYHTEEFTHQAVAALIAAGAADVGMGTRAAATRFGLAFQALGWETYFLAIRDRIDPDRLTPLREAARRKATETEGYAPPADHHSSACG